MYAFSSFFYFATHFVQLFSLGNKMDVVFILLCVEILHVFACALSSVVAWLDLQKPVAIALMSQRRMDCLLKRSDWRSAWEISPSIQ